MALENPQILLTGIGVVSPLGVGWEAFGEAARQGAAGIDDLTLFEPCGACEHAAEVEAYDWKQYVFSKQTYADRCTELTVGAARLALEHGGFGLPIPDDHEPVGFCFGTEWGCMSSAEKFYEPIARGKGRSVSSLVFSHSYPNCPTSFTAIELGLRGYSTSFAGSSLAGLWALRSAVDALRAGTANRMLVAATDALSEVVWAHWEAQGRLPDTRGQTPAAEQAALWSQVPGEAAVALLLETDAAAAARNATGLAYLAGVEEGGEATAGAWCCGHAQAAGPFLDLILQHATGVVPPKVVAAADGEILRAMLQSI